MSPLDLGYLNEPDDCLTADTFINPFGFDYPRLPWGQ